MNFRSVAAIAIAVAAFSTVSVVAQEDPVKARQDLMEEIGDAAKVVGPMLQGKAPFDAAKAKSAMEVMAKNADVFPTYFPEGSTTGDTEALPAIWANFADFEARADKLSTDAAAAAAAADQGEDAFKAAAGAAFANCKGCHEQYRKPS